MNGNSLKKIEDLLDKKLEPINKKLDEHGKKLDEQGEKIDAITAELHQVHKLAGGTYDLVKLNKEKQVEDSNEIRKHVGLPLIPSES